MIRPSADLDRELLDALQALGLIAADGSFDTSWFTDPLARVSQTLSDQARRTALERLLSRLLAASNSTPGTQWQRVAAVGSGELCLTISPSNDGTSSVWGAGARWSGSSPELPNIAFSVEAPLVRLDATGVHSVIASASQPLRVLLRLEIDGGAIGPVPITAVVIALSLAGATHGFSVTFEKCDLGDGRGPGDVTLDPFALTNEATGMLMALVRAAIAESKAVPGPSRDAIVTHLLPVLGLDPTDHVPHLALEQLASGGGAVRAWMRALAGGGAAPWLSHLAGVFRGEDVPVAGNGSSDDPWRVELARLSPTSSLMLVATARDESMELGFSLELVPAGAAAEAALDVRATMLSIPFSAAVPIAVLPMYDIGVRAPASDGDWLAGDDHSAFAVRSLRAGIRGTPAPAPLLELMQVRIDSSEHARVDLSTPSALADSAKTIVRDALRAAIGNSPAARHLLALAGIIPPAADASWPHDLDLGAFVSNPLRAIGSVHRRALLDSAHPWTALFDEIVGLAGLTGPVVGVGNALDPWRVGLAAMDPVAVELIAWDAGSANLRVGIRATAEHAPMKLEWRCELLGVDLPATGDARVRLGGAQEARVDISPIPAALALVGTSVSADALSLSLGWSPDSGMHGAATISNLAVSVDGQTVQIPQLTLQPSSPVDPAHPESAYGVDATALDALLRTLLARAAISWGGYSGFIIAGLLGVHDSLADLPDGWPTLRAASGSSSILSDPAAALQDVLKRLVSPVAGAEPALPAALEWLAGTFGRSLPKRLVDPVASSVTGRGAPDDPWVFPIADTAASVVGWLAPAGPPGTWAAALDQALLDAQGIPDLLEVARDLARIDPRMADALSGADLDRLGLGIARLAHELTRGDGLVPYASAVPVAPGWDLGNPLHLPHASLPRDQDAVSQILDCVDQLASAGRVVVLVSPTFRDPADWSDLLTAAATRGHTVDSSAQVDLRVSGLDPSSVGLDSLTPNCDYYALRLGAQTDSSPADAQIARVVDRVRSLHGGARVIIVGHSTAGLAARAFVASNPAAVLGLITLGTPLRGAPLTPLRDSALGDTVRRLWLLGVASGGDDPLSRALAALIAGLDGWERDASDLPPRPLDVPWRDFISGASLETAGVPALALGGAIGELLVPTLKTALIARLTELRTASASAPTHLAFGIRAPIPLGDVHPGDVRVDADFTGELFRIDLTGDRPRSAGGTRIAARIQLTRDSGWLVGSSGVRDDPGSAGDETRVREASFEFAYTPDHGATTVAHLVDVAHRGVASPSVALGDVLAEPGLGAIADALDAGGVPAATLRDALIDLGVGVRGADGSFGFSTDALVALRTAPGTLLSDGLATALARPQGWLGFVGGENGPWTRPSTLATISRARGGGWSVALQLGADTPIALADEARFGVDAVWSASTPAAFTLEAGLGRAALSWSSARGTLSLDAPGVLEPLVLWPASDQSVWRNWFAGALPGLLVSAATTLFVEAAFGPGIRFGAIHSLLQSPTKALSQPQALGRVGGGLDRDRLCGLFGAISGLITGAADTADPEFVIPGGFRIGVTDDPGVHVRLATDTPIAGVVDLALDAALDADLAPSIGGRLGLRLDLGNAPWGNASITFGKDASGFSLVVTPANGSPIQLLPHFGGFGSLASGLEALLPRVLDSLVGAVAPSPIRSISLEIASALGMYDSVGGFAAHADALRNLGSAGALDGIAAAARDAAMSATLRLFQDPTSPLAGALPGTFARDSNLLRWSLDAVPGGAGSIAAEMGWVVDGARAAASLTGLRVGGAAACDVSMSYGSGATSVAVALDIDLLPALGVAVAPRLELALAGGALTMRLLPFGAGSAATLAVEFAPAPHVIAGSDAAPQLAALALALAGSSMLDRASAVMDQPLCVGGPSARGLLRAAGLLHTSSGTSILAYPLPHPLAALGGMVTALATATAVSIGDASLAFDAGDGRIGVRLSGAFATEASGFALKALFGPRDAALADPEGGLVLELLERDAATDNYVLSPRLRGVGLGVEIGRPNGDALVSFGSFRVERATGYVFFDLPFGGDAPSEPFGAALALDQVSLPLGLADAGGNNPVAASLVQGSDGAAATPGADVLIARRRGSTIFRIDGSAHPMWIDVERTFGPLAIQRIGIEPLPGPGASILIDGGVSIAGLKVQVDDLSVSFALADVLRPAQWSLDLAGLALGYSSGGVSIAGGLVRSPGPPVEYDGLLMVRAAGRAITAIGAYARPSDASGSYTSFFAFVALPWTLGGPPFFFVTGLAAGLGYNRALIVPTAVDDVPSHPLVRALDSDTLASDPMGALRTMRQAIPARRGGLWIAAGVRFTSFGLIQSRALVYVALDSGVEVGVLGVSQLVIPSADEAIASVQLALKARFSSAERLLSVQAQLTDQSWIFSRSCQLTGGFAFYAWFDTGEVVLTLGGYSKQFARPAAYPVVPRLGFRWQAGDHATATGEAYFALTTSCVMTGGSLSIDYRDDGVHAWFTAAADILVSWDPFWYNFSVAVEVGVSATFEVCFIECGSVTIDVSIGAGLRLYGPPLAGEVTVDLDVASVTIPFGDAGAAPQFLSNWDAFAERYLFAGDPAKEGVRALLATGAERGANGSSPPDGSTAAPWLVGAEASFAIETRMPAVSVALQGAPSNAVPGADVIDIAPMKKLSIQSTLDVRLERQDGASWTLLPFDPAKLTIEPVSGPVPEATWRFHPLDEIAAAANNLTALVGATMRAQATGRDPSAIVAAGSLVSDDSAHSRPLPFARPRPVDINAWHAAGVAAETLIAFGSSSSASNATKIADAVLGNDARFTAERRQVGLGADGLSPASRRALTTSRSSPPYVAPLSQGMTMRAPGLASPPSPRPVVGAEPVSLDAPRLRAVLRPVISARASGCTSARAGIAIRGVETGSGTAVAHAKAFAEAEAAVRAAGVSIPAGVLQVWDLPVGARIRVSGTSAVRIVSLARGGAVLSDLERLVGGQAQTIELANGTTRVAIAALGVSDARTASAFNIAGWSLPDTAVSIAPDIALVNRAHVTVARQSEWAGEDVIPVAKLIGSSVGVETALPGSTRVVAVLLDEADCTAADAGDLVISIRGATVGAPVRVAVDARRALLYELTTTVEREQSVAVTAASGRGFRIAGVISLETGLGEATDWLRKANLQVPPVRAFASATGAATVFIDGGNSR